MCLSGRSVPRPCGVLLHRLSFIRTSSADGVAARIRRIGAARLAFYIRSINFTFFKVILNFLRFIAAEEVCDVECSDAKIGEGNGAGPQGARRHPDAPFLSADVRA